MSRDSNVGLPEDTLARLERELAQHQKAAELLKAELSKNEKEVRQSEGEGNRSLGDGPEIAREVEP